MLNKKRFAVAISALLLCLQFTGFLGGITTTYAAPSKTAERVDSKHFRYDNGKGGVKTYTEGTAKHSDGTSFFIEGAPRLCAKSSDNSGLEGKDSSEVSQHADKKDFVIRDVNNGDKKANYIEYEYQIFVKDGVTYKRATRSDLQNSPNVVLIKGQNAYAKCVEIPNSKTAITFSNTGNASDANYRYVDSAYIQSSDGNKSYTVTDPQKARTFVWTADKGGCKEYITVNKVGDTAGVLHHNGPSPNVNGTCDSNGYDKRNITIADPTVAGVKSSSKAPGTGSDINGKTSADLAGETEGEEEDNSCESKGGILGWIMCPVIELLDGVFNWLDTQIQAILEINKDMYTDPDLYTAWSRIRNIAYIILIPIMLVMIVATAIGADFISAYTVKRAMPRMFVAVIFITFSWYICTFLIGFFNVIGSGVIGVLTQPFGLGDSLTLAQLFEPSVGGTAIQIAGAGGIAFGIFALTQSPALLGLVGLYFAGAVLTILAAFLVLTARQLFIIAFMMLSPLAILSWIFPGNDKFWKIWWGAFSKLLIMYPLITGLIAIGRIFAYLIGNTDSGGLQGGVLNPLLKIAAYVIPYALIPFTFKFAGGVFANLSGMVNDRNKGLGDRLRKGRAKQLEKVGEGAKTGGLLRTTGRFGAFNERLNRGVKGATLLGQAGVRPSKMRTNMRNAMRSESEARVGKLLEEDHMKDWIGDDAKVWAARYENEAEIEAELIRRDAGRYAGDANAARRAEAVAQIQKSQRLTDTDAFRKARIRAQAKTGTGYMDADGNFDASLMVMDVNEAYGSDRNGAGRAIAEMRGLLTQSGQVAGVAGFGAWATETDRVYAAQQSGDENTIAAARQMAHENIMEDAIDAAQPGQAVYGKPSSAAAFGAAHARRIQRIAREVSQGRASIDDLSAAVAGAAGIADALNQASPGNGSAFSNELFSVSVDALPAFSMPTPGGGTVTLSPSPGPQTIRQLIDTQMHNNPEFVTRRSTMTSSTLRQAEAMRSMQPTANPNPGGTMPTGGGTTMP